jgi:DNA-binding CsgD family transcriptional regulator/tetratricopeptide (TPR) repeat protein
MPAVTARRSFADLGPGSVRVAERRRVFALLERLDEGIGGIIELTGEPGMGKTRLLGELMDEARRRGVAVLSGRCTEHEQEAPLQVFSDILGNGRQPHDEEWLRLRRMIADVRTHGELQPAGDAGRIHVYGAARSLLAACARDRTVVILDDFHWADVASVSLVDYLVRWPIEGPMLLVIVHRPRQASPWVRGTLAHGVELGTVRRIELNPLTLPQAAELLGLDDADESARDLYIRGGGTPMYLLALADAGLDTPDTELPEWFTALLSSEIAALSERESVLATAAAVLGDGCDIAALAFVAGESLEDTCEIVGGLTRRDLLRPISGSLSFSFRHPLLRSAFYGAADPARRIHAHRRALEVLARRGASPAELAGHLKQSLTGSDGLDLQILRRTAERAIRSEPATTVHWLRIALRGLSDRDDPRRAELLLLLARALGMSGRLTESRDILHEILALTPAAPCRVPATALCAMVECLLGNYAEARGLLDTELANRTTTSDPEIVSLMIERGLIGAVDGDVPDGERCERVLAAAREVGDQAIEAGALGLYGLALLLHGHIQRAFTMLVESATIVDGLSDGDLAAHPEHLGLLGWAETLAGRYADSERHFARAVALARRLGQGHLLPVLLAGLGNAHRQTGQLDKAHLVTTEAIEASRAIHARHVEGMALAIQSLTIVWSGRAQDSRTIALAEAAAEALRPGTFGWSFCGAMVLASARILGGEPRSCAPLLVNAGGGAHLPGVPLILRPVCYALLAAAAAEAGQPAERWAELSEASADECGLGAQRAHALVARANAMKGGGDFRTALDVYAQAGEEFRSVGMPIAQARVLLSGAEMATAAGSPETATTMLVLARELARRCGTQRMCDLIDSHRQDLGAGPDRVERRAPEPGLSVLTSREAEIAVRAGAGKKTREIATELSLSPRTVDVHLTKIYRKLNISSRTALARLIAERQMAPGFGRSAEAGSTGYGSRLLGAGWLLDADGDEGDEQ